MRIGLIGCGRVGIAVVRLLQRDNKIAGVYDKYKKNERRATRTLHIMHNPPYKELISQSDVLLIATPDDVILDAFGKMRKYIKGRKYIFHFSGILPAEIFPKEINIHCASVHPFTTFPEIQVSSRRRHFYLSIEGNPQAVRIAGKIFNKRNFTLRRITKKEKTLYHLTGVFSSNLLVGLIAAINELASKIDWHQEESRELIFPIIYETLNNIKKFGIRRALSGPLRRGDVEVVKKHLNALKRDKNLYDIYKALSQALVENVIDGKKRRELKRLLR